MNLVPRELDICVSNQCNMRCRYCYSGNIDRSHVFKLDLPSIKLAVLRYLAAVGGEAEKISISGGEPLLDAELLRGLVPWLRKQVGETVKIECFTNGLLLSSDIAELFAASRAHLKISLDGAAETHNRNRVTASGRDSFKVVTANIGALPARLKKTLGISATITRTSLPRLASNIGFLLSLGVGDIGVSFAVQEKWGRTDLAVLRKELRNAAHFFHNSRHLSVLRLPRFGYMRFSRSVTSKESFCAHGEVSIGPDGFFYPCSVVSASKIAQTAERKKTFMVGDLSRGIDVPAIVAAREKAFSAVAASGHSLFLSCLLCVYYTDLLGKGNLCSLLESGAAISGILREEAMGHEDMVF